MNESVRLLYTDKSLVRALRRSSIAVSSLFCCSIHSVRPILKPVGGGFLMVKALKVGFEIFEFIDFEPSRMVAASALEKLGRIFVEAPSDSSARASLRKTLQGFEGRLQIRSAVGTFVADVTGTDPLAVLNGLSRKVRSQIRVWKRFRFPEES